MGGIQSATGTVGSAAAVEAHQDLRGLTADEPATDGAAGVEKAQRPTCLERTDHLDPDTAIEGTIGIRAGVELKTERQTG